MTGLLFRVQLTGRNGFFCIEAMIVVDKTDVYERSEY